MSANAARALPVQEVTRRDADADVVVVDEVEPAMLKLLRHRYGDGLVYLRGSEERDLYRKAMARGLINDEGYVTAAGRSLLSLAPGD
jgi:hypothetical protein